MLIVLDEACGIAPQIWKTAIEGLVTNDRVKVLAIGNPTDPESEFARCFEPDSGWNCITIKVQDTPNFIEGREVIPGLAGRGYEQRLRKRYGVDSSEYRIRVLGQFPLFREGTFYGSKVAKAIKDGRLGFYPHDETELVYVFSDLGKMHNALLFAQFIQSEIRVIDCFYDNSGIGLPGVAQVIKSKPYIIAEHWTGPDIAGSNRKSMATGTTLLSEAAKLGMHLRPVEHHTFDEGVESVRGIWPKITVNKATAQEFVDAARTYRLKKNEQISTEDRVVYHNEPVKDWSCHVMDALRHMARAYRYHIVIDDRIIGYTGVQPEVGPALENRNFDLLSV